MYVACVHFALLCVNHQDGKTVDLSEIVDVRLEFDDPTLVLVRIWHHGKVCGRALFKCDRQRLQGGRSTLLNFQFTDNKNNIVYRLSADEEDSAASNLETRSPNDDVDMWLCILRHHALADDTPRISHREPPAGSLHLPERVAAQEKLALLRHVMSPSALRKVVMSEEGRTTEEELALKLAGPGQVEDGVEWEDVADNVYLLIEHTKTKREGHTFKFRLRESIHNESP